MVFTAEVEEIHGFADVQERIGVVVETPFFTCVVEICLDEKVWTEGGWFAVVGASSAETLLPFWTGAVCDCCYFTGEFHACMRGDGVVVEASVPVGIHHEYLALGMAHGDTVRVATCAAGDADDSADAVGEQDARGEGLHAAHGRADAGVELVDAEVVEEAELRAHHVVHGEDGESRCVAFPVSWIDTAWSC